MEPPGVHRCACLKNRYSATATAVFRRSDAVGIRELALAGMRRGQAAWWSCGEGRAATSQINEIDKMKGNGVAIEAVPTWYRGERFRSRLEADWCATLDHYQIGWEYEPDAVNFHDGIKYLPDFHLPMQRVWVEVKGPGDDNIDKAIQFQKALDQVDAYKEEWERQLVIIARPSRGGMCVWEGTTFAQDVVMLVCSNCDRYSFLDYAGAWRCRFCHWDGKAIWNDPGGNLWWPGQLPFVRAPRSHGRAA